MIKTRDRIRFVKKELFRYRQDARVYPADISLTNLSPEGQAILEREAAQVLIRARILPLKVTSDHHVREILSALAFSQSTEPLPEREDVW